MTLLLMVRGSVSVPEAEYSVPHKASVETISLPGFQEGKAYRRSNENESFEQCNGQ